MKVLEFVLIVYIAIYVTLDREVIAWLKKLWIHIKDWPNPQPKGK